MRHEGFGIDQRDQLEIRRAAVMGAIEDDLAPKVPREGEVSEETEAKIDAALAEIRKGLGVSEEEAEVILAERWMIQRKRGEY